MTDSDERRPVIDPAAFAAELRQRLDARLATAATRRTTRQTERRELAERRRHGLAARHTTKLARKDHP